jgi:aminopeptidase N
MRTDTPQTIYRQDYTPPSYLVDTVELGFDLDPLRTIVASRLTMRRNPASAQREIELYGDT